MNAQPRNTVSEIPEYFPPELVMRCQLAFLDFAQGVPTAALTVIEMKIRSGAFNGAVAEKDIFGITAREWSAGVTMERSALITSLGHIAERTGDLYHFFSQIIGWRCVGTKEMPLGRLELLALKWLDSALAKRSISLP